MMTIICQNCQEENEAGAEKCIACGRLLAGQAESSTAKQAPEVQPAADAGADDLAAIEKWLNQLPEWAQPDAERLVGEDESLPAWLQAVRAHAQKLSDDEANELMDFLDALEPAEGSSDEGPAEEESAVQAKVTAELPEWVAALTAEEQWPDADEDAQLAQRLAEIAEDDEESLPSTGQLPNTRPLDSSVELEGIPDRLASDALPGWLAAELADQIGDEREVEKQTRPRESRAEAPQPVEAESSGRAEAQETAGPGEPSEAEQPGEPLEAAAEVRRKTPTELEQALAGILDLPDESATPENVDQWLNILEDMSASEEPAELEQLIHESDLDTTDVPEWLRSLQAEESIRPADEEQAPPAERGPLAGLRNILPVASIAYAGVGGQRDGSLRLSKEQRQRAAILRRLTAAEAEAAPAAAGRGLSGVTIRAILGLALLVVILLGWLLSEGEGFLPWERSQVLPKAAEQAQELLDDNPGQAVLVAFEYTPAMAGELDRVAEVLLTQLAQNGNPVLSLSTLAAGVPVAESATAAVVDLESSALGYLPGDTAGQRALGGCISQDVGCDWPFAAANDELGQVDLADVEIIIVLAAERETLVSWIEQVGAQSDVQLVAGTTQALGPVARPYLASGQLAGAIEGLPVAAAYGADASRDNETLSKQLTSYTLAQWLVIAALGAGAIYFGFIAPAASAVTQVAKK